MDTLDTMDTMDTMNTTDTMNTMNTMNTMDTMNTMNTVDTMDTEGQAAGALEKPRTAVIGGGSDTAIDNPGASEDLDINNLSAQRAEAHAIGDWDAILASPQGAERGGEALLLAMHSVPNKFQRTSKLMGEFRELLGV
ncbi:hypothetical protein NKR19_g9494 [Coniochaeta hoffmannii]|uniref:Uncharacterized protein n=1 Tax=Coniochaeta hoffmannii TaxID=91930 RepID=A0AA38VBC5_9PEZI|nr:hypothetical protein NKR19_g9494 [Coniochaeta hoffmannii]